MSNTINKKNVTGFLGHILQTLLLAIVLIWIVEEVRPDKTLVNTQLQLFNQVITALAIPLPGFFFVAILRYFFSDKTPPETWLKAVYFFSWLFLPLIFSITILLLEIPNSSQNPSVKDQNTAQNPIDNSGKKDTLNEKKNRDLVGSNGKSEMAHDKQESGKNTTSKPTSNDRNNTNVSPRNRESKDYASYFNSEFSADTHIIIHEKKTNCFKYKSDNSPVTENDFRSGEIIIAIEAIMLYPIENSVLKSSTDINEDFILINKINNERIKIKRN